VSETLAEYTNAADDHPEIDAAPVMASRHSFKRSSEIIS
jgi:hypothetical protein